MLNLCTPKWGLIFYILLLYTPLSKMEKEFDIHDEYTFTFSLFQSIPIFSSQKLPRLCPWYSRPNLEFL